MQDPDSTIEIRREEALKLAQSGDLRGAKLILAELVARTPEYAEVNLDLGIINQELGLIDEAKDYIHRALEIDSDFAEAYYALAVIEQAQGNYQDALEKVLKATVILPDYAEAWLLAGSLHDIAGEPDQAEACLRTAVTLQPESTRANLGIGRFLRARGQGRDALSFFRNAIATAPDNAEAHKGLAEILLESGFGIDEAINSFNKALEINPGDIHCRLGLASALIMAGQLEGAKNTYLAILQQDSHCHEAIAGQARVLRMTGKFDECRQLLKQVMDAGTDNAALAAEYAAVCNEPEARVAAILSIRELLDKQIFYPADTARLHFALGRLLDENGDYDTAFDHFTKANNIKAPELNPNAIVAYVDKLIDITSRPIFKNLPTSTLRSEKPIFIVGMPRSGSTLVEQILSSHHSVFGAGELVFVGKMVEALASALGSYPDCIEKLTTEILDQCAGPYLDAIKQLSASAERVTDKMPHNFLHLALLSLVFPDARVIHCTRNAHDMLLSCYTHDFAGYHPLTAYPYTYDLDNLSIYYQQYIRLMDHWANTLDMPIKDVAYEDIVLDQQATTHDLLDFCGLEWDDNCMRFHESGRPVQTMSYRQVRTPLYTSSIGRWENYRKHLGTLAVD